MKCLNCGVEIARIHTPMFIQNGVMEGVCEKCSMEPDVTMKLIFREFFPKKIVTTISTTTEKSPVPAKEYVCKDGQYELV